MSTFGSPEIGNSGGVVSWLTAETNITSQTMFVILDLEKNDIFDKNRKSEVANKTLEK